MPWIPFSPPVKPVRLHRRKIDDLREGEGDHREVDVLPPDRQPAEGGTKQGAGQAAGDDAEFGREADRLHEVAGDIAAEAEIRGLAEGEQPDRPP